MKRLNRAAAQAIQRVGVHACADITGFALLGHGAEMAEKSGVRLRLRFGQDSAHGGAEQYAEDWLFPGVLVPKSTLLSGAGGICAGHIAEEMRMLLFTPETSGGLFVAVAPKKADALRAAFESAGQFYAVIGDVVFRRRNLGCPIKAFARRGAGNAEKSDFPIFSLRSLPPLRWNSIHHDRTRTTRHHAVFRVAGRSRNANLPRKKALAGQPPSK